MPRIFISYRREDSVAYAGRLFDRLSAHFGAEFVFMDIDTIEPGADFVEVLQQTVASCDTLLAVIGKQWLSAKDEEGQLRLGNPEDFVRLEISSALERNVRVIPVLVGGARMPRAAELPEQLSRLARRQALDIPDIGFHQVVNRLIESLGKAAPLKPDPPTVLHAPQAVIAGATEPGAGEVRVNPKDGLKYVWIQPGTFMMGCSPGDRECFDNERPAHEVSITKGFWMGQTPVTQEAYQRVRGKNPSHFRGDRLPVESVSWEEAQAYCEAIGMRLPTEAEWEYAARGGVASSRYGPLDEVAWYSANSGRKTHEVGRKKPNAYGLYDMLGNVYEWVAGWYGEKYYEGSTRQDPPGPTSGEYRVVRGGSWFNDSGNVRVSIRNGFVPGLRLIYLGFRCVGELR